MLAYYARRRVLWLTLNMQTFAAEFSADNGLPRQAAVSELLAVRIRNFGGVLRELAPGASLDRKRSRLVLFTPTAGQSISAILSVVGRCWMQVSGIELIHSRA